MSKREAFKEKLKGYLEASNTSPEKLQVWFWDESGFSMRVRLFKSVEELENLLNRLLNNGELIINWNRKVKNKGNAAIAI